MSSVIFFPIFLNLEGLRLSSDRFKFPLILIWSIWGFYLIFFHLPGCVINIVKLMSYSNKPFTPPVNILVLKKERVEMPLQNYLYFRLNCYLNHRVGFLWRQKDHSKVKKQDNLVGVKIMKVSSLLNELK